MNQFTISQLQQFSGIKAHTIRIWEQRYEALNPNRTEGNTRYYSNAQLKRLLNIVSLLNADFKISQIGPMTDDQIQELLTSEMESNTKQESRNEYAISQLIIAATQFDEQHFDKIFSNSVLRLGLRDTYINIIHPLLERIGLLWTTDDFSPAYEHFISNIIKQKIYAAIDSLPPAEMSKTQWLLFLPEDEHHEIGLLFAYYLIRQSGHKAIYIGPNIPLNTMLDAIKKTKSSHLLFFFVHYNIPENAQVYVDTLNRELKNIKIYISGNKKLLEEIKFNKTNYWLKTVNDLEKAIV